MNFPTKKFLVLILSSLSISSCLFSTASIAEPVKSNSISKKIIDLDQIIAVVNQEVITQQEFEEYYQKSVLQLQKRKITLPTDTAQMKKQILEKLIFEKIQMQLADQYGIKVDDIALEATINRLAQNKQMTTEALLNSLRKNNVNIDTFKNNVRKEMILARLRDREIDSKISISDNEVNQVIEQYFKNEQNTLYNLSHIMVSVPENATTQEIQKAKSKIDKILEELSSGTAFETVSAKYSDAPNALQGGAIGWKNANQLPDLFASALSQINLNQNPKQRLTSVIRSPNGFHILKLNDQRGGLQPVIVNKTRTRHILIKVNEFMSENDAKTKINTLREKIVATNGTNFAELAKINSEDGSASKGGELGWVNTGDTVPEFEQTMNRLKVGEVSQPVRTTFGWHLIQVLERKQEDVSNERKRFLARQAIKNRKSEEGYQEWLRQMRDQAYIEYKVNFDSQNN